MESKEIFDSSVRSAGDRAGVFECDGETAYFYLYETKGGERGKIKGAMRIANGTPNFTEQDIAIRWDSTEQAVGLLIREQLCAVFDLQTEANYGGNYSSISMPEIPAPIIDAFRSK